MNEINFAIIGLGEIAKTHLLAAYDANIRHNLDFSINPIASVTRKEQSTKLSSMKSYSDVYSMLDNNTIDFADICTPNSCHLEYVKVFAERRIPIYCEKPLADNVDSAREMLELVDKYNIKNAVALTHRFIPGVHLIKSKLADNILGKIIRFRFSMYHGSYLNQSKVGWRHKLNSGGGALLDTGIHLLDLVNFIFKDTYGELVDIDANTKIHFIERSEVDEYVFCNVITKHGLFGEVEASRISAEEGQRSLIEIYGEKGSIKLSMREPYRVEHFDFNTGNTYKYFASNELTTNLYFPHVKDCLGYHQSAHTAGLVAFADSVFRNEKSNVLADFEEALKTQMLVEKAYKKK